MSVRQVADTERAHDGVRCGRHAAAGDRAGRLRAQFVPDSVLRRRSRLSLVIMAVFIYIENLAPLIARVAWSIEMALESRICRSHWDSMSNCRSRSMPL